MIGIPGFSAESTLRRAFGGFRMEAVDSSASANRVVPATLWSRCNGYCDPRWGHDATQYAACIWLCMIIGRPPVVVGQPGGPTFPPPPGL